MNKHWICPECGRSNFQRKYQPHICVGGMFRQRGWSGRWVCLEDEPAAEQRRQARELKRVVVAPEKWMR